VRDEFVPSKTIIATGVSAKYTLSQNVSVSARVERSWLHEFEHPVHPDAPLGITGLPPIDSDVWLYTLGGSIKF
jgi:hypothetical protein